MFLTIELYHYKQESLLQFDRLGNVCVSKLYVTIYNERSISHEHTTLLTFETLIHHLFQTSPCMIIQNLVSSTSKISHTLGIVGGQTWYE